MECPHQPFLSDEEYKKRLYQKIIQNRVPVSGSFNLTHRCNLRCVHCYIRNDAPQAQRNELTTAQWRALIDELTEAGCLFLLITGGEPLLRTDFAEIYTHAKQNGMMVTVFTNGTLINESIIQLFDDLPPIFVEISLYGATAETYHQITGMTGSFQQCMNGIEQLSRLNIRWGLKTILMTHNYAELEAIKRIAVQYGVEFRFDGAIMPRFNGDQTPTSLRVSPEAIVEKELADADRHWLWIKLLKQSLETPISDKIYICGTGLTGFHIDADGMLRPCIVASGLNYNVSDSGFAEGWKALPQIRMKTFSDPNYQCAKCQIRPLCGGCPAYFKLETGSEDQCSKFLCRLGHYRLKTISQLMRTPDAINQ